MSAERLLAPAKLTLSLKVTGRRPDGYHCLEAEMVSIDLCDVLVVDDEGDGLEVIAEDGSRGHDLAAGDDNLVRRALQIVDRSAHVRLHKRIPVGGGLGGGSADAAAILRWAGRAEHELAARLGADVPFCVTGGRAIVRGIGEQVEPLPFEPRQFVLVVPPFAVDTAAVYRAWDSLTPAVSADGRDVGYAPAQRTGSGDVNGGVGTVNDLTAAALVAESRLESWRDAISRITGRTPALAGSGSTWWIEGSLAELGLTGRQTLHVGAAEGRIVEVRTVPTGWTRTAGTGDRHPSG